MFYMCVGINYGSVDVPLDRHFSMFPYSREEASSRDHMWWAPSLASEQSRDNPYRAFQTVTTKKGATTVLDVLMLKQLIPARSASFLFLWLTSSVVLMSGADAHGTA